MQNSTPAFAARLYTNNPAANCVLVTAFTEELVVHFFEFRTCVIPSSHTHISLKQGPFVYIELPPTFLLPALCLITVSEKQNQ